MWTIPRCTAQSAASAARRSTLANAASSPFKPANDNPAGLYSCWKSPRQLRGGLVAGERLTQGRGGFFDLALVGGRGKRAAAFAGAWLEKVVHQADPVATGHRAHLVLAVRVERGHAQLAHFPCCSGPATPRALRDARSARRPRARRAAPRSACRTCQGSSPCRGATRRSRLGRTPAACRVRR